MKTADFVELKKSLFNLEGFKSNSYFMVEEERIDAYPFSQGSIKAEVIEARGKNVSNIIAPNFSKVYFIDGVQRTVLLGEVDGFPIFLHFSGAALIGRNGKLLSPFGEPPTNICLITHPSVKISSKIGVEFVEKGFENMTDMSPFTQHSSLLRKRLEQDLFKKAVKFVGDGEVLVYDGPLFYTGDLQSLNVVGVIKRHSVLYLPAIKAVLSLEVGDRSPAFVITRGQEGVSIKVVSFYLRLFKRKNPYYGVVRVELPFSLVDKIDVFASFIFSERFPVSFNVHQSDKKLYPIAVCEKYLSSRMPSIELLSAFLSDVM
ncbi:MAG: hypothetical protein GON13_01775 [Nanoarchaeota archaeon]|nr:hypothetical protein [Nanoarchaeota archaeon]